MIRITRSEQPSTCRDRYWIAVAGPGAYGPWVGKWLLYVPAEQVDKRWPAIAGATLVGRLGIAAKVSTVIHPSTRDGKHVICVYTGDCRNLGDMTRVLTRLRQLGYGGRLSYKEDGATHAQVYGRGAALYVAQAGSTVPERRREPIPVPPEHLQDGT